MLTAIKLQRTWNFNRLRCVYRLPSKRGYKLKQPSGLQWTIPVGSYKWVELYGPINSLGSAQQLVTVLLSLCSFYPYIFIVVPILSPISECYGRRTQPDCLFKPEFFSEAFIIRQGKKYCFKCCLSQLNLYDQQ